MSLSKFEKKVLVGCPWFFGITSVISGLYVASKNINSLHWLLMGSTGLICMSLYCVCALLVKIIESK